MELENDKYWLSRWLLPVAAFVVSVVLLVGCFLSPDTTILLVRHADRLGKQDLLSQEGIDRASKLVHVLAKAEITAVFHSEALRTQRTAQDLAVYLGIMPLQIDSGETSVLVAGILGNHAGETVLVVSHSNVILKIIKALGGPFLSDINHDEYDNLYVVRTYACQWGSTVTNLQYGVPGG